MVDIHAHILWGLDDGPKTRDESVALLQAAAAAGTTDIVATPHASPSYPYQRPLLDARFQELAATVQGISLHLGCDFHLTHENIEDAIAQPSKYTIDGGPYLLVEFSDLVIFNSSEHDLERLRDAGMIPVITHPERNPLLRQRGPLLERWVEQGCRLQVTASSYLGRFGSKARAFAEQLTAAGIVHFVASDAHDVRHRPPDMNPAYSHIVRVYGPGVAERLFVTNPRAALLGEPVPAVVPAARRWRRWIPWWRS